MKCVRKMRNKPKYGLMDDGGSIDIPLEDMKKVDGGDGGAGVSAEDDRPAILIAKNENVM